jgi:hypothetical protein
MLRRVSGIVLSFAAAAGCSTAEPVTLATGQEAPWGIAVKSGSVYWTASGAVRSVPAEGGALTTLFSGQAETRGIATDGVNVYWATEGTPQACPADGGTCAPPVSGSLVMAPIAGGAATTLATGQNNPLRVATDGVNVYWTDEGTANDQAFAPDDTDGAVMAVPVGGGTPIAIASNQFMMGGLATDGASVYWTRAGTNSTATDGAVMKAPVGGGTSTPLATGQYFPTEIAVDATSVYWITQQSPTPGVGVSADSALLMKVPKDGGAPTMLATTIATLGDLPSGFAVDDTSVYFVSGSDFLKVPIGGGPAVPFAIGEGSNALGFALDATDVYWTDATFGKVMKTPKSP